MSRRTRIAAIATLGLLLASAVAAFLVARRPSHSDKVVGVFLYAQHQVIQEIFDGFRGKLDSEAARREVTVHYVLRNGDGNASQTNAIASYFRNADADIVFVVGVPAAQALKAASIQRPVIFGGPPDPVTAGLVPRLTGHGTNFTGTKYFPSQDATVSVFKSIRPSARTVAVLHNPGEANSAALVSQFKDAAATHGLDVQILAVTNTPELEAALRELLARHPDGVFLPTDNFVYSALDHILRMCSTAGLDVFSCTRTAVERGALFGVGADYQRVGEITADVASRILFEGQAVHDVDVVNVEDGQVFVRGDIRIEPPAGYRVVRIHD